MTLGIICAGYPRTGTSSLASALEYLGLGPCYHGERAVSPRMLPLWSRVLSGEPVDWDEIFRGFRATSDLPSALFYAQLSVKYPASKIILTIREPNEWYASSLPMLSKARLDIWREFPGWPVFQRAVELAYGDDHNDRTAAIERYLKHNEAVRATISPDRLLVYDVRAGWDPLCKFLGLPIPDAVFPRVNKRSAEHITSESHARARIAAMHAEPATAMFVEWVRQGLSS